MDVERIIDEIQQLQEMFEATDIRPLSASDLAAANRRHDELFAHSPWFRLWQEAAADSTCQGCVSSDTYKIAKIGPAAKRGVAISLTRRCRQG